MCTQYLYHIHPPTPFSHILIPPTGYTPTITLLHPFPTSSSPPLVTPPPQDLF
jgi:hypothetical protein